MLRTHHALADGTALMRVIDALTEPAPPEAAPGGGTVPRPPVDEAAIQGEVQAIVKLGARIFGRGTKSPPLSDPLCGAKSVTQCDPLPIARLKDAGRSAGATLNDVYLAAIAGALRTHLGPSGVAAELDVVMPVNVRRPEEPAEELGNRFGLVFVGLPTAAAEPDERRRAVAGRTTAIKATTEAEVVARALPLMGGCPGWQAELEAP